MQGPDNWVVLNLPAIAERDEQIQIGEGKATIIFARSATSPCGPTSFSDFEQYTRQRTPIFSRRNISKIPSRPGAI